MSPRPTRPGRARRRPVGPALALCALLLGAALPLVGERDGARWPLANGDFAQGLAGWRTAASDGGAPFSPSAGPQGDRTAVRAALPPGVTASLALTEPLGTGAGLPVGAPEGGAPGEKVAFGLAVWLGGDCGPGSVQVRVEARTPTGDALLCASPPYSSAELPRERWVHLAALPAAATDGRVPADAAALRFVLELDVAGTVYVDDALAGPFGYAEYPLAEGGFEGGALDARWRASGAVTAHGGSGAEAGYFGAACALLGGAGPASIAQRVELDAGTEPARAGHVVEAGAWMYLEPDAQLGPVPDPAARVELVVRALRPGGATELARAERLPTAGDRGRWVYVETAPLPGARVAPKDVGLEVRVRKTFPGGLRVDDVRVGERFGVHGHARRQAACSYLGRYRSPLFAGAGADAQDAWRNWRWVGGTATEPAWSGLAHDPDCATSSSCFRPNGRRDLAVTTRAGADRLPLVGAYDSRDPEVVAYHVALADAVGVDHLVYDWQGALLGEQQVLQGVEPVNDQTLHVLLAAAGAPEHDVKVAVMYEPKVHMLGWVAGEPTHETRKLGIATDLARLVLDHGADRALFRHDGRIVVYLFRQRSCTPDGAECLTDAEWGDVADAVEAITGERLFLVADSPPLAPHPFGGLARWRLVDEGFLAFRTYADFRAGTPSLPPADAGALAAHAGALGGLGRDFAAEDDTVRVGVALAWPGFDDTGVAGWGMENGLGSDGQPLCVRVAAELGGAFYATTADAARASGADWIQVATWNDWNEDTAIEPAWHPAYAGGLPPGGAPAPEVRAQAFGRALETQAWIADWKGEGARPRAVFRAAHAYLRRAVLDPAVTLYD